ncbi:MBL fold metallo-hydrolase [Alkalibacterium thalassium]|uniref:Phosphoribosyl 1,2-cyclic phosphodiesterase n=1 Tax=Alkalibacterium thalassium TaxID=426701 RepID=A0A1G8VSI3_9LACT|nr:MBL fold metallo-hydrolase [Alkalibacterium thalassium]SDJ68797.1 Phosphoribosyl 1,2-cyclic phosphodiesterase [Alkalibacterium thalassium]
MEIQVYGSSSAGNSYIITEGNESLMIEAGIDLKKMRDVKWQSVVGCLISHEHGDHSKHAHKLLSSTGVDIYTSQGTADALQLPGHRVQPLKALVQQQLGSWSILPFDVQHDVQEPLGFFIQTPAGNKILFATDTYYIKYKFPGITHLMIECNYALDILNENVANKRVGAFLKNRVVKSHFELGNVKSFIKSNDMSQLEEVWLLHLSNNNSNEQRFKTEIQELTGTPVYVG